MIQVNSDEENISNEKNDTSEKQNLKPNPDERNLYSNVVQSNDNKTITENVNNNPTTTSQVNKDPTIKEDFKRQIVTQSSKNQREFNNKIEQEQIKLTEEINEIKETLTRKIREKWETYTELKSHYDNQEELLKLEITTLNKQIEQLKKENSDLKDKIKTVVTAAETQLQIQRKIDKLNKDIQNNYDSIKTINVQCKTDNNKDK